MTLKESMEIIDSVETDEKTKEAITLAKAAMEKQIAKKPKHIHEEYEKHLWKTDARGNVDEWAFESGFCKGVLCLRCGETECVHCNPDYDKERCVVDKDCCPNCGEALSGFKHKTYCEKCGQAIDWGQTE